MTEDRRELHEQWMLLRLGIARQRPAHLVNPYLPERYLPGPFRDDAESATMRIPHPPLIG